MALSNVESLILASFTLYNSAGNIFEGHPSCYEYSVFLFVDEWHSLPQRLFNLLVCSPIEGHLMTSNVQRYEWSFYVEMAVACNVLTLGWFTFTMVQWHSVLKNCTSHSELGFLPGCWHVTFSFFQTLRNFVVVGRLSDLHLKSWV